MAIKRALACFVRLLIRSLSARLDRIANRSGRRRAVTKYSFLAAINDVVNDTHTHIRETRIQAFPLLFVLLSRAAVTTAPFYCR